MLLKSLRKAFKIDPEDKIIIITIFDALYNLLDSKNSNTAYLPYILRSIGLAHPELLQRMGINSNEFLELEDNDRRRDIESKLKSLVDPIINYLERKEVINIKNGYGIERLVLYERQTLEKLQYQKDSFVRSGYYNTFKKAYNSICNPTQERP